MGSKVTFVTRLLPLLTPTLYTQAMLLIFVPFAFIISAAYSHDSGSAEANKIELTPFYDTIIFSDVADIINEFENNVNPLEAIINSASESEENIEDLLSEYQHYLEKAHKQRINYMEKTKTKNKVPLIRHDRYAKTKPAGGMRYYDDFYPNGYSIGYMNSKIIQPSYSSPVDIFFPFNSKLRYIEKSDVTTPQPKDNHDTYLPYDQRLLDLPPVFPKPRFDPIRSSCYCKANQVPCECKCKQCWIPINPTNPSNYLQSKYPSGETESRGQLQNIERTAEEKQSSDNELNIRIKVDIQLPNELTIFGTPNKNRNNDEMSSKDNGLKIPFNFNFPIPMDLLGYKKSKANSHDASHKITMHKKKKSRPTSGSKKHKKKVITIHNFNLQAQPHVLQVPQYSDDNLNTTELANSEKLENATQAIAVNTNITTQEPEFNNNYTVSTNSTKEVIKSNETQADESIFVTVNITNDNVTEDFHKIENSVETEFTKWDTNVPTEKAEGKFALREKREVSSTNTTSNTTEHPKVDQKTEATIISNVTEKTNISVKNDEAKKHDKLLVSDTALSYWPNISKNESLSKKNITTIILEIENKKAKLNMTKETIKNNRTRALEKAIFGDVNWEDVDTVAPVFLSFVGKYLTGVLTFCSQNICHSMKCEEKTCIHRVCDPSDRWNQRGHCLGSNITDSIASLESILDLPSNVVFEIVDILQDKMLGKLFGKVTMCINSKCISFVAMKKMFMKSKCTFKELKMGYCPNIKNSKTM